MSSVCILETAKKFADEDKVRLEPTSVSSEDEELLRDSLLC